MDVLTGIWDFVSRHVGLTLSILFIVGTAIKLFSGDGSEPSAHKHDYDTVKKEAERARSYAMNDVRNRYSKHFPGRKP